MLLPRQIFGGCPMMENITKIDNVYSLTAVIGIAVLIVAGLAVLLIFILRKFKNFHVKIGDKEIDASSESPSAVPVVMPAVGTDNEARKPLTEHPFFSDMLKWERRDIPALVIKSELKRLVVVEFLKIKFRVFREMLRDYVANAESAMSAGQDFSCDSVQQLFLDGIDRYNDEARKTQIVKNNRIMQGIPEMFLTKFDKWHSPHVDMIAESIGKICNNEIYPDDRSKLLSIIEIFYIAFNLTVIDAIGSINELNGELEKLLVEKLGA